MSVDVGLLILRLVVGVLFVGHGAQKLFGWFGGPGMTGTTGWLGSLGLRPAGFWAFVVGLAEFGGGVLVALGLLNPLGALAIISSMLVAIAAVHWPKLWVTEGGFEYPLVNIAAVTAIALTGPGEYSLDAAFGIRLPMPVAFLVGLAVVVVGAVVALGTRARPAAEEEAEERRAA